jgi:hypothetical protein
VCFVQEVHICIASKEEEDYVTEESERNTARKIPTRQILIIGFSFIVGFIILGVIAIQVWEYSNSVHFCTNFCHDVHPEEIEAFEDSYHASIKCVECHMGRLGTIQSIILKAGHFGHLPAVLFDRYERPLESVTMRPANESCELCHFPPAFHGDTVREIIRFQADEENTLERVYLILRTAGGVRTRGLGMGIHWHIANPVEFVSGGLRRGSIPWVRTTLPDGRTVEYTDVTNPPTDDALAAGEVRTMDCVDCHNRVGHPFPSPEDLIHDAMATGALSTELPAAKRYMEDLLTASYADREEALQSVDEVRVQYEASYPEVARTQQAEIEQAAALAREFLERLVFEEPGVTWRDFPNQAAHKDFPGCFRCHDGKHLSADGESIRLHCNICHSIPLTVFAGQRPPDKPVGSVPEPASHLETNFMADHRFQATEAACSECHGDIHFGADDSGFCANSSCHGRSWPEVELDAAFPHPIPLEGAHAAVWCHDCHEGVRNPAFECSNCHVAPQPHFGENCEGCHAPTAWEDAELGQFIHPIALEGAHAEASCLDCHSEEVVGLPYICANCHQPPPRHFGPSCESCHVPTSFSDATLPPELHPVPLEGAHAQATCDSCHADGRADLGYVCANCHERPANHVPGGCNVCHTPEGFAESAGFLVELAPRITHPVQGREDCLMCHDPAGNIRPAPRNHVQYQNEQCGVCHRPAQ